MFPEVCLIYYCALELLKAALFKRHPKTLDRLWRIVEEEWNNINIDVLRNFILSLKSRCNTVVQQIGYQIEHIRYICLCIYILAKLLPKYVNTLLNVKLHEIVLIIFFESQVFTKFSSQAHGHTDDIF